MFIESFGKRLREAREERGYSQRDIAEAIKTTVATISRYESETHEPKRSVIKDLAQFLNVNPAWLMGADVSKYFDIEENVKLKPIPVIGTVAAGQPIICEENIEGYEYMAENSKTDFILRVKGDSMINARILNGDLVYVRKQQTLENGEIGVIQIDEQEATLKRFYKLDGYISLRAENPHYSESIFTKKEMSKVKILGKAVAFKSEVR